MHPIIFTLQQIEIFGRAFGPIHIFSYGVFLALAFLAGLILFVRDGNREGIKTEDILDLTIYIIISSIVGARILYVLLSMRDYAGDPIGALKIYQGGLSFHGGAIGGTSALMFFGWRKKIPVWKLADCAIRPLILGSAIARFGCFFNGCCYGYPWHGPWAVVFPVLGDGIPRHPTQMYDAALHIILLGIITYISRFKRRDRDISAFYLIGFSILRFIVEFFRRDATGKVFADGLTQAQWASFLVLAAGLLLYFYNRKKVVEPAARPDAKKPKSGDAYKKKKKKKK